MKKIFIFILVVMCGTCSTLYGQKNTIVTPNTKVDPTTPGTTVKENPVYLTPSGVDYDTVAVYAVIATTRQPLAMKEYKLILKNWVYEDGKKQLAEQILEQWVDGVVIPISDFQKKIIFITRKDDFKE